MALILSVRGFTPNLGSPAFIAENATIIGDVTLGDNCSIWFNAILRGDVNSITIGDKVNIQDGAIIHGTFQKASTNIGNRVSVGHRAIVHGCMLKDDILVGMGSIIMDHAIVESKVLIAAGAVVLEGAHLESGFIYGGVPAKKIKPIDQELLSGTIERIADAYITYSGWYQS
jgi:carbonic anhydrase/acetyltransferase-like protein (isoleucine patch superfamily)